MKPADAFGCAPVFLIALSLAAISTMFALGGCGSAPLASELQKQQEEARLMVPFTREQTISATNMVLTMTANFYNKLTIKVNDVLHDTEHKLEPQGGALYTYQAKFAGARPIEVGLGDTTLLVVDRMQIRVLGGPSAYTLDVSGEGALLHRNEEHRRLGRVEISKGAFQNS